MTNDITVTDYDRTMRPNHPEYDVAITVTFSTGVRIRHVVTLDRQYLEQVFRPEDYDTVYDDIVVDDEFDPSELDSYVSVWLDVTMEDLQNKTENWDSKLIRGDSSSSPTNVRFES